jgi:hypothetical protein
MRSALFSLATLVLLAVGFIFYWRAQPIVTQATLARPASAPTTKPSDQVQLNIGPGANPWVHSYDEKGRLASMFTATEYLPQKDRSFKVVRPIAVFFLDDGQYMSVTGETGVVFVDAVTGSTSATAMNMTAPAVQAPNNGMLHQVHVALYPSASAANPTLWLDVNNLSFDNDTGRLYTQSYADETGATIAADKVPVTVRGDDYEFDGTGLILNWNDRDRRLQLLEIAHGGRLQIRNPAKMSVPWSPKTTMTRASHALPEALVAADPAAAGMVLTTAASAPPTTSPVVRVPYRAVFNDNVRVEQGDRQMASADTMLVDFLPAPARSDPKRATTAPAVASAATEPTPPLAAKKMAETPPSAPTTNASVAGSPAAGASPAKSAAPTTQNQPITVYWTGKLRVTPLDSTPVMPIADGQAAVRLVGSPVELTPEATVIHAAAATYRNDGAVLLEGSSAFPLVELMQDRGMSFTSERIAYDPATQLATITGHSDLHLPLEGRREQLTASWTRQGILHFIGNAARPESVDRVDLSGQVVTDHPDFNIKSEQLAIDLEKPSRPANAPTTKQSGATVKRATASGDVRCRLIRAGQTDRGIDGDRLVMETATGLDGKPIPRTVVADGNVHAFDPEQNLRAGHLDVALVPKAKLSAPAAVAKNTKDADAMDAVEVESLFAKTNVHAELKTGAIADADQLRVTTKNGKTDIELRGGEALATIADGKGSTLSGPLLHLSPERSLVTVDGPGSMHAVRRTSPSAPPRPVDVSWTDSLTVDGPANMVDAIGQATVKTTDPNGTINTLSGDSAHIDLVDAKPDPKAAKKVKSPTTQTGFGAADFGNKELKAVLLQGRVHGTSLLLSPDGSVLRRGELYGSKLTYDAQTGKTAVPGPGQLFVEDHRKPEANADGNNRGSMAVQWKNGLVHDETARQIVIDGDTIVGFRQEKKDATPMRLTSQRVTMDLAPSAPTNHGATTAPGATSSMQVSHVRAEGGVEFVVDGKPIRFHAHRVDYDPSKERLTAVGSEQDPAFMEDEQGMANNEFSELVFDTRKQDIDSVKGPRGTVRH